MKKIGDIRLGGTSWVVNGSLAENLLELSRDVGDMEIVLFDTPEMSNMPTTAEVAALRGICRERDMTCTVHLPQLCRGAFEDVCLQTMELFAPLDPFAWIFHYDSDEWQRAVRLAAGSVDDRRRICVENVDGDFSLIEEAVYELGLSFCVDVGHLVKSGRPVLEPVAKYLDRTRVLHIHGVEPDGFDHVDMSHFDKKLFNDIIHLASDGKERVMSMEVFEDDYRRSLKAVKGFLAEFQK